MTITDTTNTDPRDTADTTGALGGASPDPVASGAVERRAEWDLKTTAARQRTSEMTRRVVDTAMDVAGGSSIRSTVELSRLLCNSRAAAHPPPAVAFAHEIVAKGVLGVDPEGPGW